jgi:hypothetical protein
VVAESPQDSPAPSRAFPRAGLHTLHRRCSLTCSTLCAGDACAAAVGSFANPVHSVECVPEGSGFSTGTFVSTLGTMYTTVGGTSTASSVSGSEILTASLIPGVGVLTVERAGQRLQLLSTVAVATHPASAAVIVLGTVTFTVALTANSATTGLTYAWTKAGVPVGTSSPSYTYTATAADVDAGPTYAIVCRIVHAMGHAVTNTATLTVQVGDTADRTEVTLMFTVLRRPWPTFWGEESIPHAPLPVLDVPPCLTPLP